MIGMIGTIFFIVVFVIFAWLIYLQTGIGKLQDRIDEITALLKKNVSVKDASLETTSASERKAGSFSPFPVSQETILSSSTLSDQPSKPTWVDNFIAWVKEDWLLKLGALLVLIGFSWFVTYAFLHNWIGPVGRIALGLIAGVLILVFGWFRMQKYLHQGAVFLSLGAAVILLTIAAGRGFYDFFTPTSALFVDFLSMVFVALASVKYRLQWLSIVSLVLAGMAPLLVDAPATNYLGLFSYLLVVTVGTVWVVALRGWRVLTAVTLILVSFYSFPPFDSSLADPELLLLFAYAFAAIFFVTNTLGILKLKDKDIIPDLVTAAGNGLFLLAWILAAAKEEWKSLIFSAWMMVFAMGSFSVFRMTKRKEPFFVYAGIGVVFLAAATAVELSGPTLTIAYTLEAAAVSLLAYILLKNIAIAEKLLFLLIVPILFSLKSLDYGYRSAWQSGVFHKDFFVLLTLAMVLLGLGVYYWFQNNKSATKEQSFPFYFLLIVAGSFYAYALLWLSLRAALGGRDTAIMISLAIYTVVGLAVYLWGVMNNISLARKYGAVFLGLIVLRLFVVDVWRMELTEKIITFFLVGMLLIGTAFLGKKRTS